MPTRQYVGARYVPKFADPIEWDNTRAYEALEIVTNLGTSYTSKKAVPVGVAISNTEYWVATGNYNSQVEHYVEEVQTLAESVGPLGDMSYLKGKKILVIGDSISWSEGYCKWVEKISALCGDFCEFVNASVNGNRILYIPGQLDAMTSFDYDMVIIFCGTNDYNINTPLGAYGTSDNTTFCYALESIYTKLNAKFAAENKLPDIWYISPLPRNDSVQYVNTLGFPSWYYNACIEAHCKNYGHKWICGYGFPLMGRDYISTSGLIYQDYGHPNDAYGNVMASYILQKLLSGGDTEIYGSKALRCYKDSDGKVYTYIEDGVLHIAVDQVVGTPTNHSLIISSNNLGEFSGAVIPYTPVGAYNPSGQQMSAAFMNISGTILFVYVESTYATNPWTVSADMKVDAKWLVFPRRI